MWTNRGMGGAGAGGRRAAFCCIAAGTGILLAISLVGASGCGGAPTPPAAPPPVRLASVDHAGLLREVNARRGQVVVLDCWSTSCPPCVKEFPGLVKLAAAHGDRVACLSLSFDYDGLGKPDDLVPPVRAFLEKVGAGQVVNMVSREEADSLYRKLDLVSVPAIMIWKPDGSLAVRYDDDMAAREFGRAFTYADVEQTVTGLLAD